MRCRPFFTLQPPAAPLNTDLQPAPTLRPLPLAAASSTAPGPNAPLSDGCGNSRQPLANAYAAVNSWHKAGMPLNKIMLGTAAYGYISASSATALVNKRAATPTVGQSAALAAVNAVGSHSHKRSWGSRLSSLASKLHRRAVTVTNDAGGTTDGQITFVDLINQGALGWDNSQRMWVGANGFTRVWDACSSTVRPSSRFLARSSRALC